MTPDELYNRIQNYLGNGGLFNPECMQHDKALDLLLDVRNYLTKTKTTMKTKLITALRTAANALENATFYYEWQQPAMCNCGSLFCALTGLSSADLKDRIPAPVSGTSYAWSRLVGQYCPITGMPTQELFSKILGYGLTTTDIVNLEFLNDEKVLARVNITKEKRTGIWPFRRTITTKVDELDYKNKEHVIAYMRAWADLLTEEGALDTPDTTSSYTAPTSTVNECQSTKQSM